MRTIAATICLAVLLPVTLLFGGVYFSKDQYHVASWWFFAALVIAGLGGTLYVQSWLTDREGLAAANAERLQREADDAARKEAEIRPYIDTLNPVLSPLVVGQTPIVRITVKNTGKTPAVDLMVGARVQIGDFPLFTDTTYEAIDAPRVTLGAEQSATVDIPADHPLTEDELAGLKSGMKWLKAHGEIVFTADPRPKVPFTHPHFCFVLTQLGKPLEVCDNFGDHSDSGVFR